MARGKGRGRGQFLSRQGRGSGDCSTSVESSSRVSHDMQFPATSAVGTSTQKKGENQTAKQYDSDDCTRDNYYDDRRKSTSDDTAAEKPVLEAYCDGSWWDVEILKKDCDNYYVHYVAFPDQNDQWLPFAHLRMRSRTSYSSDCYAIKPGIHVCVMARHPHSDGPLPAWYDAKIIDIERKPHTPKACKCSFRIALFTIPDILPRDYRQRKTLPVSPSPVSIKKMSIMREAMTMSFLQVVTASLPGVTTSPRIWAKDGIHWYSSFSDYSSVSRVPSFSFESKLSEGSRDPSLSRGHREECSPSLVQELRSFNAFLEEEGLIESPASLSPDERDEDDVSILPVHRLPVTVPTSRDGVKSFPFISGSKVQPVVLDMDDEADSVEISEKDGRPDMDFKYLDRYSSDEKATSPERLEDILETPNLTTSSETSGSPYEDLEEVAFPEIFSKKQICQSPIKPVSVTSDVTSPLPVQTVPLDQVTFPTPEAAMSSENSDVDDFADYLERYIAVPVTVPIVEPATSSEMSDVDDFADFLERSIAENHGAKRRWVNSQSRRGSNLKSPSPADFQSKGRLKMKYSFRAVQQRSEQVCPTDTEKEQARVNVSEKLDTVGVTLARSPVKCGRNVGRIESIGLEKFADGLKGPVVRDILARSREVSKTGLATQKKVRVTAAPKIVAKEITYAELFDSVEPVHLNLSLEEKGPTEGSGLSPSWNPLMESLRPAPPQDVQGDPLADVWEDMRVAQECGNMVNDGVEENVLESTRLVGQCENLDGSKRLEHAVMFNQEVGVVCEVCGIIVLEIKNMWERDNAKRIATTKEVNDDNEEDMYGSDHDALAFWDSDDDNHKQQNDVEGGSNIELIPDLAKHMQSHQKQGFQFLWRNLAGQDFNGNPCSPPTEPGGCVLSHAPGTGKTFLIISFLQSYMKKYPHCRPVIVAPKIMLQPWEKEFRKWNVDIPVYNFNRAGDQGRLLFQQHEEAGDVQLNSGGRPKKQMMALYREAMLFEWMKTPSVLVISYHMFSQLTLEAPASGTSLVRKTLLERPHILILDEGHFARNKQAQVRKQLMAVKTPLRIMLSGTLFQNNFEELYTSLNLVRSGFVKTFAKAADLKFNIQQETEPQGDVEKEQFTVELKEKSSKATEAQARKLFIEGIGNKIDKGQKAEFSPESLAQGLEQLRRLTSPFVHHYTGSVLRNLPPLRDFAIMLQLTALQEKIVLNLAKRLLDKTMLERECLMSLVCIHPTLFSQHNVGKTLTDLLSAEEMTQVASCRDPAIGVKTRFVVNLLKHLRHGQEKILIFCQNLDPLILLEEMLKKQFGWVREQEILHLDGKVPADERQSIIERFNDPEGRVRVMMASTKACGEGITLTGASRVVFMDVLWNPAVIRQAIHRAFRIGQTKVVHVYRLVATGTFEESKYRKMVWKDWKSQAIFYASDGNQGNVESNGEVSGTPQHSFWEIKKQSSKDPVLNELSRQDSALDQPAFKHIFRHGGLFDDDYDGDPEGRGVDASGWLRGIDGTECDDIETDDSSGDGDNEDYDTLEED